MCQKRTDSQKPLSGAWAKVQGHATAQLQLSNQSPVMCQLGISAMTTSIHSLNDDKTLIVMMPPPCVDGPGWARRIFTCSVSAHLKPAHVARLAPSLHQE